MLRIVWILTLALLLASCASGYGYVYDYDPFTGPVGRYVGPLEPGPRHSTNSCARPVYQGPFDGGVRGPYYVGPYCAVEAQAGG